MSAALAPATPPLPPGIVLDDPLVARAVQRLGLDVAWLAAYCERWGIAELSLFGSVLRDDFRADSDVDMLVEYRPGYPTGAWGIVDVMLEGEERIGRPVDLVEPRLLSNPYRRREILATARLLYRHP